MVKIIYIDTLFAFNFVMSLILLKVVKKITKEQISLGRELSATFAGTCFAVFFFVLEAVPLLFIAKLLSVALCVLIAFGYGGKVRYIKILLAFLAVHFGMGGGIYALYFLIGSDEFQVKNGTPYFDIPIGFFVVSFIAAYIVVELSYKIFTTGKGVTKKIAKVKILLKGHEYTGLGLVDTGSNLYEPISGKSAIVVERWILGGDAPTAEVESTGIGIRFIPYTTLQDKGFLTGIKCESVLIETDEKTVIHKGIYLALTNNKLSGDSSFNMIISHNLTSQIGTVNF